MKLYEIAQEYTQALNMVDEDWVFTEQGLALIEKSELSIKDKATNISNVLKEFEWVEFTIDKEIERLKTRKKAIKTNSDKLKNYLSYTLQDLWLPELITSLNKFTFRKSESIEIENEDSIPKEYIKETIKTAPDKTALKKAIKDWKEIKWVKLVENNNLQIK